MLVDASGYAFVAEEGGELRNLVLGQVEMWHTEVVNRTPLYLARKIAQGQRTTKSSMTARQGHWGRRYASAASSTPRGDKTSIPWPASPPSTFRHE